MELQLDVIAVLLVFGAFCVGSALLIKKANEEMKKQELENPKPNLNDKSSKDKK